jgi:hypothetical protein
MPKEYEGYTTKDEKKAVKDAETVVENAPDEKTKSEATSTLTAAQKPAPNPKPPEKSYDIESLKKNPLDNKDEKIAKQNKDAFNKLNAEEKKKFVVKAKLAENQYLDKKEQHELSKEDLQLAGVMT